MCLFEILAATIIFGAAIPVVKVPPEHLQDLINILPQLIKGIFIERIKALLHCLTSIFIKFRLHFLSYYLRLDLPYLVLLGFFSNNIF